MKIVPISVKLVHATGCPAHVIEEMGRICYQSEPKARLRLSPKAHPQMRQVMALVAKELVAWCPVLFEDVVYGASGVQG